MKVYYSWILFIYENLLLFDFIHSCESLLSFDFIYSWNSFTFYLFMKVFSHILHHSCKIYVLSHIFFEHLHDFKTHTYVQIKIKFSKIAFLSKYCKFDTWSYFQFSFSKFRHMNSFFLNLIIFFFNFQIWSYNFFLLWKKEKVSHERKKFYIKKEKRFYFVILLFDADSFETRIHWISLNMKHEVYIILNIANYS